MPNAPKTPQRSIRIPDDDWLAAQAVAQQRGEDLSSIVRAALRRYVKRHQATAGDDQGVTGAA